MAKNRKQKAVSNYLVIVLPPIVLGLFIGLLIEQRIGWLGPTAFAGLLLGVTTAFVSIFIKNNRLKKIIWWLHTMFGFSVASFSIAQPILVNKEWNSWFGIVPGVALGAVVIVLSLIVLGAESLGKVKTANREPANAGVQRPGPTVTERAQVSLFTPRNRETQEVDVTRTLEDIGHGARADLLSTANESRRLDLEEIKLINQLGDPADWSPATRNMVSRRYGQEIIEQLTKADKSEREEVRKTKGKKAIKAPQPIISGWGYRRK